MERLTDVLTAISHPTRRAIIERLSRSEARVTELAGSGLREIKRGVSRQGAALLSGATEALTARRS